MKNTIQITTYDNDMYQIEILVRSIRKYLLEPCNFVVLYCSKNDNWIEFKQWFDTYMKPLIEHKCNIKLLNLREIYPDHEKITAWKPFSYFSRILVSDFIDTDYYWFLDSKNFFFKPTYFKQLKVEVLRETQWKTFNLHPESFAFVKDVFPSITPQHKFRFNYLPFLFKTSICREMVHNLELMKKLEPHLLDGSVNECFAYEGYCYEHDIFLDPGQCDCNKSTWYFHDTVPADFRRIGYFMKNSHEDVRITGLHGKTMRLLGKTKSDSIISFVGGKDLLPQYTDWTYG